MPVITMSNEISQGWISLVSSSKHSTKLTCRRIHVVVRIASNAIYLCTVCNKHGLEHACSPRCRVGLSSQDDTAIQSIGKVSHVVRRQEAGSDLYDRPLLKHLSHWGKLFRREVQSLAFPTNVVSGGASDVFDEQVSRNALLLSDQIPSAGSCGRQIGYGAPQHTVVRLLLADGQEVRGVLQDGDPDLLQLYFGKEITIFGKAVYRPSGTLLRIDAQEILDTVEGRSAFSVVPPAFTHRSKQDRKIQTSKNGVAAFSGVGLGKKQMTNCLPLWES